MNHLREELVNEHARLDQALNDLACAAESADANELLRAWSELEADLLELLDFEERELFPLVEPFHAEGTGASSREHERIRKLVADLGIRADLHTLRKDVVDGLVETLRQHAEHEDRTVYHWLEENAPEDTRRHLLGLFVKTARADVQSGAAPKH
jgi:hypothetical protein